MLYSKIQKNFYSFRQSLFCLFYCHFYLVITVQALSLLVELHENSNDLSGSANMLLLLYKMTSKTVDSDSLL